MPLSPILRREAHAPAVMADAWWKILPHSAGPMRAEAEGSPSSTRVLFVNGAAVAGIIEHRRVAGSHAWPNTGDQRRVRGMTPKWFLPFFQPRSVLLVGASSSPEKLGYGSARNLIASGYKGAIHFVAKKEGEVFGRKIYADLEDVPTPIDLAILIVPSEVMPLTIEACGRHGVKAAIIVSGGFGELGPEGRRLEAECLSAARRYEMRLMGPNCIGILDTHLPLDTTFLQSPLPKAGGIALISHSGAFCAAIVDWARHQPLGFSRLVSLGNQIDINETDVLEALADDDDTRVIVAYLENISDGIHFVKVARLVTPRKPVIALKAGRFASGQLAAASHTGAMAASDIAFDAAFAKAGVLRAETVEQVFDWARALQDCPLPRGRRVAVLTDAGGLGVIAADALETQGLSLADLSAATREELARIPPRAASTRNPVDLLASASPEGYAACLQILLADAHVDMLMVIIVPPPMFASEAVAQALTPLVRASDKPVVFVLTGSDLAAGAAAHFTEAGAVFFPFPERAASALGVLVRRSESLESVTLGAEAPPAIPRLTAELATADDLMDAYEIPHVRSHLARSSAGAVGAARSVGYPVVMKIASADISHKSDIGGVLLNVNDDAGVASGFELLTKRANESRPDAVLDGILIQHQVSSGHELIVGAVRDPKFGPLIMFGSGGTEAEGRKDVAFSLCPVDQREAEQLIQRTWAGQKLDGFRNIAPAHKQAVVDIVMKVSRLAQENPTVEEFELNPVVADASGAISVDARVRFADADPTKADFQSEVP